jgi:hypothetical protein
MRFPLILAILALAACSQATVSRIDSRTFAIQGPGVPGGSDVPNRRLASRVCPNGYRVLTKDVRRHTPDGASDEPGVFTNWTIRCL